MLAYYVGTDPQEAWRTAAAHLDRAQELEPDLAEAHAGRALLANNMDRDPESAIGHARKALAANPSYIDAMNWLVIAYLNLGRYEEANATQEQMLDIDPLTIIGRANYAGWLRATGRNAEAHELAGKLLAQSPLTAYGSHSQTSLYYEGEIAEGLSWGLKFFRLEGGGSGNVELALSYVGEYDEARRLEDSGTFWIDTYEGRYDRVVPEALRRVQLNPEIDFFVWAAAEYLYAAGRIDEALPYFEHLLADVPEGRPISSPLGNISSSNEIF